MCDAVQGWARAQFPPQLSPCPLGEDSVCRWPRLEGCGAGTGGQPDARPPREEGAHELSAAKDQAGSESEPPKGHFSGRRSLDTLQPRSHLFSHQSPKENTAFLKLGIGQTVLGGGVCGGSACLCHFQGALPSARQPVSGLKAKSKQTNKQQQNPPNPNKLHQKRKPNTSQSGTIVMHWGGHEGWGAQKCPRDGGLARAS